MIEKRTWKFRTREEKKLSKDNNVTNYARKYFEFSKKWQKANEEKFLEVLTSHLLQGRNKTYHLTSENRDEFDPTVTEVLFVWERKAVSKICSLQS